MNTIIATGNGFSIGYDPDGNPVQTDHRGDWFVASNDSPFTDEDGQEYRCINYAWAKTDDCGNEFASQFFTA